MAAIAWQNGEKAGLESKEPSDARWKGWIRDSLSYPRVELRREQDPKPWAAEAITVVIDPFDSPDVKSATKGAEGPFVKMSMHKTAVLSPEDFREIAAVVEEGTAVWRKVAERMARSGVTPDRVEEEQRLRDMAGLVKAGMSSSIREPRDEIVGRGDTLRSTSRCPMKLAVEALGTVSVLVPAGGAKKAIERQLADAAAAAGKPPAQRSVEEWRDLASFVVLISGSIHRALPKPETPSAGMSSLKRELTRMKSWGDRFRAAAIGMLAEEAAAGKSGKEPAR